MLQFEPCDADPRYATLLKSPPLNPPLAADTVLTVSVEFPAGGFDTRFDVYSTSALGHIDLLLASLTAPVHFYNYPSTSFPPTWNDTDTTLTLNDTLSSDSTSPIASTTSPASTTMMVDVESHRYDVCLPRGASYNVVLVGMATASPLVVLRNVTVPNGNCVYSAPADGKMTSLFCVFD